VAKQVLHAVSDIVETQVKDPRLGVITFTDARVSADLRHAVVYFSLLPNGPSQASTAEILAGASGFVRRELGRTLGLRYTPSIRFEHDETVETAERIDRLLTSVGPRDEEPGAKDR